MANHHWIYYSWFSFKNEKNKAPHDTQELTIIARLQSSYTLISQFKTKPCGFPVGHKQSDRLFQTESVKATK